jgi:hypothetical protein
MLTPSASSLPTHHSSPEPLATEPAEASTSKAFIARRNLATSQRLLWLLRCTQHQQQWDHLPHHRANCVARDGNNYIDLLTAAADRVPFLQARFNVQDILFTKAHGYIPVSSIPILNASNGDSSLECQWVYCLLHIYIHTQNIHTHTHIYIYIKIYIYIFNYV